jgi:hypothetical protein
MSDAVAPAPDELPVLIGGAGTAEVLLLVGVPQGGRVTVRRWSGDDWSAAPALVTEDVMHLLAWIEAQAAAGRTLNQSLYGVRLWLRREGAVPPSR